MKRPPIRRLPLQAYSRADPQSKDFPPRASPKLPRLHRARSAARVDRVGIAEILVLLGIGALLFFALTPFRRWVERRYVRQQVRARGGGVVIPMRKRADGSYGPVNGEARREAHEREEDGDETKR
jgi:hypothetical protein